MIFIKIQRSYAYKKVKGRFILDVYDKIINKNVFYNILDHLQFQGKE